MAVNPQYYGAYQQGLLDEGVDPSDGLYGTAATGLLFAPGAGLTDVAGYAPDPSRPGEYLPSFTENIGEGQYLDAGLQLLGGAGDVMMAGGTVFPPLAGAGMLMKAPRAARVAQSAPASIRAYHGSPYDFDKFDISKIGTGEGAQMYGRGLYFAESPDVARSYRDELTEVPFEYRVDGKPVPEMYNDALRGEDYELAEVLEQLQLHDTPTDLRQRFTTEAGYSQKTEDYVKGLDYDSIKGFDPDGSEVPLGRQYEVEIAADPEMMLDYQSPLIDQPKAVQDAYKSIFFDKYQRDDALSELFPTIDDLDMQSVGLLERSTGGQAYKTLASTLGSEEAANEALLKAGIPGVKYLDLGSRFGAKNLKDATHNYVVFDGDTVSILRKYGLLAPLAGGGAAAAVMGADEPQPAGGIL